MAKAPVLDRVLGWISPRLALTRHIDRQRLTRAYEAASPRDQWRPRRAGASANADHMADGAVLRGKARAIVQNVPYVKAGLDALVNYTVGTGIIPRATGRDAATINNIFAAWCLVCDADGRFDFYGLQAAAYRAMEQDGEVLIRLRPRRPTDGLPAPLQLQLLEIDWLDTSRTQAEGPNQVVNGVEYDPLGRTVAYWLWDQHPGDVGLRRVNRTQSRRVPASSIIHLFAPDRPGQGRGFSRLAPIIPRVRDLQLYEDAELARKNLETRLSVLATGDASQMAQAEFGSQQQDPVQKARETGELGTLSSGGITELPPGMNITVLEPKVAPGHVEYVKHQLHVIATGMGVTYEMLTGDMAETNFSSARVRLLQFRTAVEQMRWLVLVPRLLQPIWEAFIDAAYLGGQLGKPEYAVDFSTPKWDYVNPEQEAKADQLEISMGLSSLSEKLRQRGYKPEEVFDEIAKERKLMRELDIEDVLLFLQKGSTLTGPEQAAVAAARESEQLATRARETAIETARAMPAPVHNITLGDTVVNERAVTVEAPTVNVAAPSIHVDAPQVHTPAPTDNSYVDVRLAISALAEGQAAMRAAIDACAKPKPARQVIHEFNAAGMPVRSYLAPIES